MRPVIVVSPPRSGTSVVARILHEDLGVCMGHLFGEPNASNPRGFFEEQTMWKKSQKLVDGHLGAGAWLDALADLHAVHGCRRYGLKDPRLVFAPLRALRPALVIRPRREPKAVAESWVRWQRPPRTFTEALEEIAFQEHRLDEMTPELLELCPVLELSFREEWTDVEIRETLRSALDKAVWGA